MFSRYLRPGVALLTVLLLLLIPARAENLVGLATERIDAAQAEAIVAPPAGAIEFREPPPADLFGDVLASSGQANVLAVARSGPSSLDVLSYHTITGRWARLGTVELDAPPTQVRPAPQGFVVTTEGSDQVTRISVQMTRRLLKPVDWIVIVVYLSGMAMIGWWCYRRESKVNTEGFFLAGRKVPWWAAGISLYATGTSAVSFIAIPAKSFATDWLYLAQNFVGLLGTTYVAFFVIPLIRRLGLTSVYHYLEMRFHPAVRLMSSALCIVFQLAGRMSIVMFLPALAISGVTGISVVWCVALMGVITTLYTALGGMRAVIWTDVIQVFVMIGGALFAVGYIIHGIDGGLGEFLTIARHDGKMHTFDWRPDITIPTVWAFILVEIVNAPTFLPRDQVMMQRVLATPNEASARASVLAMAAIVIPGSILFYGIGTALYVFYKTHPERMNPLLAVDATFPHFIAAELPVGITGLIIAGIFAASMSTLSSGINSVATLTSVDFYERLHRRATPAGSLRLAEYVTVIAGVLGTGFALLLSFFDVQSLFDASLQLTAILGGGFAGTYALGMFTRRANWQGALIGTAASILCAFGLKSVVSPILLTGASIAACIFVGYLASFAFPPPTQSLAGLTIFTPRKESA